MYQLVLNGLGSGSSLQRLIHSGMNPTVLRPFMEVDPFNRPTGRNLITVNVRNPDGSFRINPKDGTPVYENIYTNAPATLRFEDWVMIDRVVTFAALPQLRLWGDIYGANPFNIPNGMGTIAIQSGTASGVASATISMDPIRKGERSRPTMDTTIIPLPVTHSDNSYSARDLAVSQNSSLPLDTTNLRLSARAVAEAVEGLCAGTSSSYSYGGGTIYGLINFPQRFTRVLTAPTGSNASTIFQQILFMTKALRDVFFMGPYVAYYSPAWNPYFAMDYATTYPMSLRNRLAEGLPDIAAWRQLNVLSGFRIVLVQLTDDIVQGVQGMGLTTVQWEEQGGFEQCFKVLCIQIPRFRANANGKTGIMDGTVP
jgi:hypothetical protein